MDRLSVALITIGAGVVLVIALATISGVARAVRGSGRSSEISGLATLAIAFVIALGLVFGLTGSGLGAGLPAPPPIDRSILPGR